MRSFLKYTGLILAFLAGLLAILILLSFLVNPKNNSQEAGMKDPTAVGFWGEPKNSIDVLVLGDSESYSSIIPTQMWQQQGITSYVCGSHAQRLCYSEELLKQAFSCQSPKIVLPVLPPTSPGGMAARLPLPQPLEELDPAGL